jgi:adenylate kinase family enzyme
MESTTTRINIVGTTGSGKSTFSKELAAVLNIPYVQIDQVYWGPDWYEPSDEEFFPKLKAALDKDSWVLDGNYQRTQPIKWKNVQAVIWLDYSFPIVFYRAVKRAITRSLTKEELWEGTGNRESFRRSFFSRDSILLWTLRTYWKNRKRYMRDMQDSRYAHIQFIRLASPAEAAEFLSETKPLDLQLK